MAGCGRWCGGSIAGRLPAEGRSRGRDLLVVRPHADDADRSLGDNNVVNEPVLNRDSPRIHPSHVTNELLEQRWRLEGVFAQNGKETFYAGLQSRVGHAAGVFGSLAGELNPPRIHQSSSSTHSLEGAAIPSRIDSRIPGILSRYRVSWMERQSSAETSTASDLGPVIWTGSLF